MGRKKAAEEKVAEEPPPEEEEEEPEDRERSPTPNNLTEAELDDIAAAEEAEAERDAEGAEERKELAKVHESALRKAICLGRDRRDPSIKNDPPGVFELLFEFPEMDLEAVDKVNGFTMLHYAAWHGQNAAIRILIDKGARVGSKAKNKHGQTPLDLAKKYKYGESIKLFNFVRSTFPTNLMGGAHGPAPEDWCKDRPLTWSRIKVTFDGPIAYNVEVKYGDEGIAGEYDAKQNKYNVTMLKGSDAEGHSAWMDPEDIVAVEDFEREEEEGFYEEEQDMEGNLEIMVDVENDPDNAAAPVTGSDAV